jgi:acyl carrier protein
MTQTVEDIVINLTQDFIDDWGIDVDLNRDTKIKEDLGFDSSDTMQLFAAVQEHYGIDFKFQDLVMQGDSFVDDLSLGQITVFVIRKLNAMEDAS